MSRTNVRQDDIIQAVNAGLIICRQDGVTVARVHEHAVLKYDHEVRLLEAGNIQFFWKRIDVLISAVIDV